MKLYKQSLPILLFLGFLCLIINAKAEPIRFFEGSFEALQKEAKEKQKTIFIDFYTDWCKPCLLMKQNTFANDSVGNFMNTFYLSYKVNCEKDTALKRKFNVPNYPHWVFMTAAGEIKYEYTGYADPVFFLNRAKEAIHYNPLRYQSLLSPKDPDKFSQYVGSFARFFPDSAQKETEQFLLRFPPEEWVKTPLWAITQQYILEPQSPAYQMILLKAETLLPIQPEIKNFVMEILGTYHIKMFKTFNHDEVEKYKKQHIAALNALKIMKLPQAAYEDEIEAEFAMRVKKESLFLAISQSLLNEYYPLSGDKYADYSVMAIQTFSGEETFQVAWEWAKKAESLDPLSMKSYYALAYYKYRAKDYANALRYLEKARIYALDIPQKNMTDDLERKIKSRIK